MQFSLIIWNQNLDRYQAENIKYCACWDLSGLFNENWHCGAY